MSISIRSERPGEEDLIDEVECRAFGSMNEANIVRLMRDHYPVFDRRYSLTAWDGEEMVGHVLFTPARVRLLGRTVRALAVGPVAVVPERQRQGVGGALLRHGHELGGRDGFGLAFLYGHPSYYPRHGYRPCFGGAEVKIDKEKLPEPSTKLEARPVRPADLPWLVERLEAELADVDFGWLWGPSLGEWSFPGLNAVMWRTEDGRRAAYTLRRPTGDGCELVLADDAALAREAIARIRPAKLCHHPSGWLARHALDPAWAKAEAKAYDAAMAVPLREGALDALLAAREAGERPAGAANFPLPFLAC